MTTIRTICSFCHAPNSRGLGKRCKKCGTVGSIERYKTQTDPYEVYAKHFNFHLTSPRYSCPYCPKNVN